MNKRIAVLSLIVVVLLVALYFKPGPKNTNMTFQLPQIPQAEQKTMESSPTSIGTEAQTTTTANQAVAKPLTLSEKIKATPLVTVQEYREDVHADPHSPSARMVKNSVALGDLLDSATTEGEAREVLAYYKNCLDSDTPNPLKAACFRYSGQLAEKFPVLTSEVKNLDAQLSGEVREILRRSRR